jgi:hypothetical protein
MKQQNGITPQSHSDSGFDTLHEIPAILFRICSVIRECPGKPLGVEFNRLRQLMESVSLKRGRLNKRIKPKKEAFLILR